MGARTSSAHVMSAQIMPDKVILTLYNEVEHTRRISHSRLFLSQPLPVSPCYALESVLTLDKASEVI